MLKTLVITAVGAVAGITAHRLFGGVGVVIVLVIAFVVVPFWEGYTKPRKKP